MVKIVSKDRIELAESWTAVDTVNDWANIANPGTSSVNSGSFIMYSVGYNHTAIERHKINLKNYRLISFSAAVIAKANDNYVSGPQSGTATIKITDGTNSKTLLTASASAGDSTSDGCAAAHAGQYTLLIKDNIVTIYEGGGGGSGAGSGNTASESGSTDGDTQDISAWNGCYLQVEVASGTRVSGYAYAIVSNLVTSKKVQNSKGRLVTPI